MNKQKAKKIAETITYEQLENMFLEAEMSITDWEQVSNVNKGISKGTSWNILRKVLTPDVINSNLAVVNMIREFGEFLPTELIPENKPKNQPVKVHHQDPIF